MQWIWLWIAIISLLINTLFVVKFYQDRKAYKRLTKQLNWIISGDALSKLRHSKSSSAQDLLVDEINEIIEQLSKLQVEFEEVTLQNKRMISSISHDFRTPLTSMLGYVQILQSGSHSKKEEKYLRIVEERTKALSELVEEFYRLSLLESNEYQLTIENVYPILLIQEQIALYHAELDETFDHITVQLMEEQQSIETSPIEFNRMLGNLIKNAFTHGTNRFSIYNELSEHHLMIYIENEVDSPSTLEVDRLFERMYRGDETRATGSTGLGLSIAKKIADTLGYELEADLNHKRLQFKLSIPLNKIKKDKNVYH
ncbi:sensor histidine kinase [Marinilactibacillus piezotolerans]|uniref:sensor histidine kinase n=1 Tax=Marinilactibacillus piezotolerans TaxID=258723 RepID=UPI0015C41FC4|nr:HAMP domain-containing sensor histidine kinase [Marinilactibacillus piezotolerans]